MSSKKFYVTTPIYYVTAKPHLGSLYSTLLADVSARWHKLKGYDTFFLTGTDEHGQKVAHAAEAVGKKPKPFVDSFIKPYKDTWARYQIAYDYFVRTTDTDHVHAVQKWLETLIDTGDIYKGVYQGWYCTPCETFVTVADMQEIENGHPVCNSCHRATQELHEESYFFRLSAYQEKLLAFYQDNPDFIIPKQKLNEVIAFVTSGLKDLSISRTTVMWGVPFPGDTKHIAYVWADALNNYITAIGYGNPTRAQDFSRWWPADLQILGKDILRFHAVYWPAFLMASDLLLPRKLLVHGWILADQHKMSKSLGNVIDPDELYDQYGADQVRYYLLRHMAVTHDSSFSVEDLSNAINNELANDLGNLLNRMLILAHKNGMRTVQSPKVLNAAVIDMRDAFFSMIDEYRNYMDECLYHLALGVLWKYINQVNAFFHAHEPWKLAKTDPESFIQVIAAVCNSLHGLVILLWPIMPHKMEQMSKILGVTLVVHGDMIERLRTDAWQHTFMLSMALPLFEKIEIVKQAEAVVPGKSNKQKIDVSVSIDDFAKIQQVIGTIEQAERVEKSDKLLTLQVNCGEFGIRQILSGLAKYISPEALVGMQAVFVLNLKPRKMMGLMSHGMLLTVSDQDGVPQLLTIKSNVPNGTPIR